MKFSEYATQRDLLSEADRKELSRIEANPDFTKRMVDSFRLVSMMAVPKVPLSIHKRYDTFPLNDKNIMKRGLEALRVLYSHEAAVLRGANKQYLNDGLVVHNNVLSDTALQEILEVVHSSPLSVNKSSAQMLYSSSISKYFDEIKTNVLSAIGLSDEAQFWNTAFVQRLNKESAGHVLTKGEDSQYLYHADIFAPSLKWWFFPEEVRLEDGPLNYSLNSCKPTKKVVDFWYDESCKITNGSHIPSWKMPDHAEGSLRISKTELENLDLLMSSVVCPANTLVIANVHGFHARGVPQDWSTNIRNSIHGSIRAHPFTWTKQ